MPSRPCPDAALVLMGYGALEPQFRARAEQEASAAASACSRPSRPDELLAWVACADVVAMPIQPSTLNHRLTTPNKLFEAMAAGVPVVASPTCRAWLRIVHETGCGALCDPTDPAAIAAAIRAGPGRRRRPSGTRGRRGLRAAHDRTTGRHRSPACSGSTARLTGKPW